MMQKRQPENPVYDVYDNNAFVGNSENVKDIAFWALHKDYKKIKLVRDNEELVLNPICCEDIDYMINYLKNYKTIDSYLPEDLFEL